MFFLPGLFLVVWLAISLRLSRFLVVDFLHLFEVARGQTDVCSPAAEPTNPFHPPASSLEVNDKREFELPFIRALAISVLQVLSTAVVAVFLEYIIGVRSEISRETLLVSMIAPSHIGGLLVLGMFFRMTLFQAALIVTFQHLFVLLPIAFVMLISR